MRPILVLRCLMLVSLLAGCVQTSQLYSVEQFGRPQYAPNDRPRVSIGAGSSPQVSGQLKSHIAAKASFTHFLSIECNPEALHHPVREPTAGTTPGKPQTWSEKNPYSSRCVGRITAYAVDQCTFITLHQNEFAATANLMVGAVAVGSALATTAYAFAGSSNDRTAATALAGSVAANGGGRGFLPSNTSTPVKAMIDSAEPYAEATGLDDEFDFDEQKAPFEKGVLKLARVHDAVLSNCVANAYGFRGARTKH